MAVGLAYAIALLERAPAHWIRSGLLFDLRTLLDELMEQRAERSTQGGAHARAAMLRIRPVHVTSREVGERLDELFFDSPPATRPVRRDQGKPIVKRYSSQNWISLERAQSPAPTPTGSRLSTG